MHQAVTYKRLKVIQNNKTFTTKGDCGPLWEVIVGESFQPLLVFSLLSNTSYHLQLLEGLPKWNT